MEDPDLQLRRLRGLAPDRVPGRRQERRDHHPRSIRPSVRRHHRPSPSPRFRFAALTRFAERLVPGCAGAAMPAPAAPEHQHGEAQPVGQHVEQERARRARPAPASGARARSRPPNRSAPATARSGCHLAKITSATAMKPRPAVIHSAHVFAEAQREVRARDPREQRRPRAAPGTGARSGLRPAAKAAVGVLADGAEREPPPRPEERPPRERGDGHGGVDQRVVPERDGPDAAGAPRATGSAARGSPAIWLPMYGAADERAQSHPAEHEREPARELIGAPRDRRGTRRSC